jgi:hypothetical protein
MFIVAYDGKHNKNYQNESGSGQEGNAEPKSIVDVGELENGSTRTASCLPTSNGLADGPVLRIIGGLSGHRITSWINYNLVFEPRAIICSLGHDCCVVGGAMFTIPVVPRKGLKVVRRIGTGCFPVLGIVVLISYISRCHAEQAYDGKDNGCSYPEGFAATHSRVLVCSVINDISLSANTHTIVRCQTAVATPNTIH